MILPFSIAMAASLMIRSASVHGITEQPSRMTGWLAVIRNLLVARSRQRPRSSRWRSRSWPAGTASG